jgi:Calcineurin-like phosphoesterase
MTIRAKSHPKAAPPAAEAPANGPTQAGAPDLSTGGPQFAQPVSTPIPNKYLVQHASDTAAYTILDSQKTTLRPRSFQPVAGAAEPVLTLAGAIGGTAGPKVEAAIQEVGQIVFHVAGDTGATAGPKNSGAVADKMVSDFSEDSKSVPSFYYHLGDVVYSFGEAKYYYDQFYDIYRDYPAPIFAIAGNHDGMVAPGVTTAPLAAFLENFCTAGQPPHRTQEAGELARTAQVQPGIYFTLEAPFVRILGLYSNCLEDPGIISNQGKTYPELDQTQIKFLKAGLARIKQQKFTGAVIIAVHHPPYVAQLTPPKGSKNTVAGNHPGSPLMLADIDSACSAAGVWPHAIFSGHAHSYQRFTRTTKDGRQTPFLVSGNGGHAVSHLTRKGTPAVRTPAAQADLSNGSDTVTLDNYDDQDFGYLRVLVNSKQLRIEYHPASDGPNAKTADDAVTVDLATRKLAIYNPPV